jgi:hypothetical protein
MITSDFIETINDLDMSFGSKLIYIWLYSKFEYKGFKLSDILDQFDICERQGLRRLAEMRTCVEIEKKNNRYYLK